MDPRLGLKATKSQVDAFTVTVRPRVRIVGTAGVNRLDQTVSPTVILSLDGNRLAVKPDPTGRPGSLTATTQIAGVHAVPAPIELGPITSSRSRLEFVGMLVALAGAALLIAGFAARRRLPVPDASEATWISSRYGSWLPPVSALDLKGDSTVRVARFAELVRLADRFDQVVLQRRLGERVDYTVRHEGTAYLYTAGSGRTVRPAPDAGVADTAGSGAVRRRWRRDRDDGHPGADRQTG